MNELPERVAMVIVVDACDGEAWDVVADELSEIGKFIGEPWEVPDWEDYDTPTLIKLRSENA